jgi:hypothetical protein
LQTCSDREHVELKRIDECTMRTSGSPFEKKRVIPTMAPPNIGASIQTVRKTRNNIREPHETTKAEQEMAHREGVVDVNAIHSLCFEPSSPTPVVEEAQTPTTISMEIDSAQGHQINDARNLQQPARVEESQRKNGEASVNIEFVEPRPKHEVGSVQK